MSNDQIPPSGGMEGAGAYNRHASLPARGGAFAVPHLENAARVASLDLSGEPIVIADYGSSQGRNSFAPMRAAITALRARVGAERQILVYHQDLPVNDFNALFEALAKPGAISFIDAGVASVPGFSSVVPEPSTWAMMLLGFAGVGLFGFAKRQREPRSAL